jgi:hypothetical protein
MRRKAKKELIKADKYSRSQSAVGEPSEEQEEEDDESGWRA